MLHVGALLDMEASQAIKFITQFLTMLAVAPSPSELFSSAALPVPRVSVNLSMFTFATFHIQGERQVSAHRECRIDVAC